MRRTRNDDLGGDLGSTTRTFHFDDLSIQVEAPDTASLHWLGEFLTPSFEECHAGKADVTVCLTRDDSEYAARLSLREQAETEVPCFQRDNGYHCLPLREEPDGGRVIYDKRQGAIIRVHGLERRIEIVTRTGDMRHRRVLLQVTRELAMARCWRPSRMIVHGAAFVREGRAVLIAGPKQAGKTTLLVHCLGVGGVEVITNDRALLAIGPKEMTLRGIPTFVSIRPGTRALFPRLSDTLRERAYDYRLALHEQTDGPRAAIREDQDLFLTPAQFGEALASGTRDVGSLAAIVYPLKSEEGGILLRSLNIQEASERLQQTLFGAGTRGRPALALSPEAPCADETDLTCICDEVARHVPSFECAVGVSAFGSVRSAEDLVQQVLEPSVG